MDNHEIERTAITPAAQPQPSPLERAALPTEPVPEPEPDPEPTFGQWLVQNGPTLAILTALFVFLFVKFDADGLWAIAKAALGLSFVIFIHELGHFLVAKWCDVHVTTFSIGFGPAIPGCRYQWGETTYKLALFPLGGYVQMVGQVDGDEASDSSEDDPRSYRNKSVFQRMAIISAGVVMNVVLAVICFVIVFQGPGKDRQAAVVDALNSDSPAFIKGIPTGAEILQIGDVTNPYFENLMSTVLGTVDGQEITLEWSLPGKETRTIEIEPKVSRGEGKRPMIGIQPSRCLKLVTRREIGSTLNHPVSRRSAAAEADPPFELGDRIIATSDPDHPDQIKELPLDPRTPNSDQRDYFEFNRRMQLLAGKEVAIQVERGTGDKKETVTIKVAPAFHYGFGARMQMGEVVAIREGSPASKADIHIPDPKKKLEGDVIRAVKVWDSSIGDWRYLYDGTLPIDPVRLPYDLRKWADEVTRKGNPGPDDRKVVLHVRRHNEQPGQQYQEDLPRPLQWDNSRRFDKVIPLDFSSPLAIPELGLAYRVKTTVAYAPEDSPLKREDVIKEVQFTYIADSREDDETKWTKVEPEEFAYVFHQFQAPYVKAMSVKVKRDQEIKEITIAAEPDKSWPAAERGFIFSPDVRRQKADNFLDAIALGMKDTQNNMVQVYQNLRGMVIGRISPRNLGGPVTIARVAYRFAGYDFWEFLFFIGLISVNLAVINFLPIPVLDGGHMVFLIYEKVRGKPASEGVRVGATYAGLALILSIMVFVLYLDISRLFHG